MKNKVLITAVLILAVLSLGTLAGIALLKRSEPALVATGQKETVGFRPVELHTEAATPEEVRNWVKNSLKFDMADFANAKEFDGKQYLFVRSGFVNGIGRRDGPKPFERLVQIIDVLIMEEEVVVKASFTKPSSGQQLAPEELYDVFYIKATGLPVRFVPVADEEIFIRSLVYIHYLPDIVAQSRSIKIFAPTPNGVVGRRFSVSGVDNTKELRYWLLDADQNVLYFGLTIGAKAPGFTRDPVIIEEHLRGSAHWMYFAFDVNVPENVVDGADLVLTFGIYEDIASNAFVDDEVLNIPLKFKSK